MLMKTDVIYRGTPTPQGSARHVTGQYLAKNRLNARARARLANEIREGRAEITDIEADLADLPGFSPLHQRRTQDVAD